MLTALWLRGLIRRHSWRLLGVIAGIAVAVALLTALGSFLSASKATMTQRSIGRVAVDWQIQVHSGADPATVQSAATADPAVAQALPVEFGATTGLRHDTGGITATTGPGRVLGLPADYAATFPAQVRYLVGARNAVLLSQQTAANLHAAPGDAITVGIQGLSPVTLTVAGIVDLPHADSLFQDVGAPIGAQPAAPPDTVLLLPAGQWHQLFDPLAATHPDQVGVQIHARLHHDLPADPARAYTRLTGAAHHLDVTLAGTGLVGDNLGAALGAARSDALYAQVLFLFLGAPAAVLAALLTATIAAGGSERRRAEQGLLRTRGASTRQLLRLAGAEALIVGLAGALLGIALAALLGRLAFGSTGFGAGSTAAVIWPAAAGFAGVVIALGTVFVPVRRDLLDPPVAALHGIDRPDGPRRRLRGLDVWLLAGAGLAWWATRRNGYQLVLAPEGVAQISVSYWAFAAPALLWLGAGLLCRRLTIALLRSGRPLLARVVRPLTGPLAGTAASLLSRQSRRIARTVVLVAMAIVFAASTAIFNATYQHQAEVDAQLTNGADVTVTEPPTVIAPSSTTADLTRVPGVGSAESVLHRFAYVGPDLQDLYGIRPTTFAEHVRLSDAYFSGGTARQLLDRLARNPDDILVSAETVKDFQLRPGDTLRLQLVDARSHRRITVPFHYAGVVKEFPTAPRDSFLVANASYIATATGNPAVGEFLVTTTGGAGPHTVADRIRGVLGPGPTVTDIQTTRTVVGSSLTALDLSGLTRLELGFAVVLAAAATGLQLLLGFAERRRLFALTRLLGARRRQLAGLVWAEIGVTVTAAVLLGVAVGAIVTELLVSVLTGVFDPPPDTLTIPWGYLGTVAVVAILATCAAAVIAVAAARRPPLEVLHDL